MTKQYAVILGGLAVLIALAGWWYVSIPNFWVV